MLLEYDLMLSLEIADYEDAKINLVEICEACNISQKDVGFFGEVGFPGISDIDAVVIADPCSIIRLHKLFSAETINSKSFRYLFCHPPVYLFNNLADKVGHLHTLKGAYFPYNCDFTLDQSNTISKPASQLLNIFWFISLLNIISAIMNNLKNNVPVSLRLLLLVYNNLMHSYNFFNASSKTIKERSFLHPQELRVMIKYSRLNQLDALCLEHFILIFKETCKYFDSFMVDFDINLGISNRKTLIARDICFLKSGKTGEYAGSLFNNMSINEKGFSLIEDYFFGNSKSEIMNNYIQTSFLCEAEYRKHRIAYPFIKPFPTPSSWHKRNLLRIVNSIAPRFVS